MGSNPVRRFSIHSLLTLATKHLPHLGLMLRRVAHAPDKLAVETAIPQRIAAPTHGVRLTVGADEHARLVAHLRPSLSLGCFMMTLVNPSFPGSGKASKIS